MQSDPARPIDRRSVQRALKIAVRRTDIHKRVSPAHARSPLDSIVPPVVPGKDDDTDNK
jgi:hypothetical protein